MKTCLIVVLFHLSFFLATRLQGGEQASAKHTAGPSWIRDFNEGQRKARAESKDLLVVFTGHGWCASCQDLD